MNLSCHNVKGDRFEINAGLYTDWVKTFMRQSCIDIYFLLPLSQFLWKKTYGGKHHMFSSTKHAVFIPFLSMSSLLWFFSSHIIWKWTHRHLCLAFSHLCQLAFSQVELFMRLLPSSLIHLSALILNLFRVGATCLLQYFSNCRLLSSHLFSYKFTNIIYFIWSSSTLK